MTDAISVFGQSFGGKATRQGDAQEAAKSLAGTFDQFLTLLTTQLQNQDPLSPTDSTQFTNQLVSFASVEQSINTNLKLENLLALQAGQQRINAISLIGKDIQAAGNESVFKEGRAQWQYDLPRDVKQIEIGIEDHKGNIVLQLDSRNINNAASLQLNTTAGTHGFSWDGTQSIGGAAREGDVYTLTVRTIGKDGLPGLPKTYAYGLVSGIKTTGDDTRLTVDGKIAVSLEDLVSVNTRQATPAHTRSAENDDDNG